MMADKCPKGASDLFRIQGGLSTYHLTIQQYTNISSDSYLNTASTSKVGQKCGETKNLKDPLTIESQVLVVK